MPVEHYHHLTQVEPHKALWFSNYLEQSVRYLVTYAQMEIGMTFKEIKFLLPDLEVESIKLFIEAVYSKENK